MKQPQLLWILVSLDMPRLGFTLSSFQLPASSFQLPASALRAELNPKSFDIPCEHGELVGQLVFHAFLGYEV
ncbi:MAG: hypothetical protein VX301_01925, partial [Pseudomonadota bacterium]|nr:hypothetical protein [Pseudomonadota bacterium]